MGVKRILLLVLVGVVTLYLLLLRGLFLGLLIGAPLILATLILTRRKKSLVLAQTGSITQTRGWGAKERLPSWKPMRFRRFLGLLWLVALIAILYSPSALQFNISAGGGGGGTSRAATPPSGLETMSPLIRDLQSSYHVVIANSTESLMTDLNGTGKVAYLLIGPDQGMNITREEAAMISRRYQNGTLSLLLSEGNTTNNSFLKSLFHVEVKGDAIRDFTSYYTDDRVFTAQVNLGTGNLRAFFDVGSPIILENSTSMWPIVSSSSKSSEVSSDPSLRANETWGPRVVAVAGETNGSRAIIVSDSAPFTTAYNMTFTEHNVTFTEKAFVNSTINWVTTFNVNTTLVLDNTHFIVPVTNGGGGSPSISIPIRLPIGRLFALGLEIWLSISNRYYSGFLREAGPFTIVLVLLTTWSTYGLLTRKYGYERRGKDDEPLPIIEKTVVAESKARMDFLATSRTKGFYVATLAQLYEVLNDILVKEFGSDASSIQHEQLASRLGEKQAKDAERVFKRLSKISQYAQGKRRLLLPPVFRWKPTTRKLTGKAENILNTLGLTMTGAVEKKQVEYRLRRN